MKKKLPTQLFHASFELEKKYINLSLIEAIKGVTN